MSKINLLSPDENDPVIEVNIEKKADDLPQGEESVINEETLDLEPEKIDEIGDDIEASEPDEKETDAAEALEADDENTPEKAEDADETEPSFDELILKELAEQRDQTAAEDESNDEDYQDSSDEDEEYDEEEEEDDDLELSSAIHARQQSKRIWILSAVFVVLVALVLSIYFYYEPIKSYFSKTGEPQATPTLVEAQKEATTDQEFRPIEYNSPEREAVMSSAQSEMAKEEGLKPETVEQLMRFTTLSKGRIAGAVKTIQAFPKGMFISFYSNSGNIVLMEVNAENENIFERYHKVCSQNKIFSKLDFIKTENAYSVRPAGYFLGKYTLGTIPVSESFYNMNNRDFIDYVADIAYKRKLNFTELTEIENSQDIENTLATSYVMGFYGSYEQITDFLTDFNKIPATMTANKIYISRRLTDTYPLPLNLKLYVTLFEREK
jgi:hypothetical protein